MGPFFSGNHQSKELKDQFFSDGARKKLQDENQTEVLQLATLINQTVGDAFSDLFAIEAVLSLLNYTAADWHKMYSDFPNRLMKVIIKQITIDYRI